MKDVIMNIYKLMILVCILYLFSCNSDNNRQEPISNSTSKTITHQDIFQDGDIIFQTSKSNQSKAIQLATNSVYSHMGIVYLINGNIMVYEAVQPVKLTPIAKWIKRGKDEDYVLKRLKNSEEILSKEVKKEIKSIGEKYMGKNYDIHFDWSDDKIYCSELVWKIFKESTGIEIGKLQTLSEFDLTSSAVKQKMKERYGDNIPLDEIVISPVAMFNSDMLITVDSK